MDGCRREVEQMGTLSLTVPRALPAVRTKGSCRRLVRRIVATLPWERDVSEVMPSGKFPGWNSTSWSPSPWGMVTNFAARGGSVIGWCTTSWATVVWVLGSGLGVSGSASSSTLPLAVSITALRGRSMSIPIIPSPGKSPWRTSNRRENRAPPQVLWRGGVVPALASPDPSAARR